MTKHGHYFKDVSHLDKIDVYRVLDLFGVQNPAIQHAIKKLLCAGSRGVKDQARDYREAIDSIERALQMLDEDVRPAHIAEEDARTAFAREIGMAVAQGLDLAGEGAKAAIKEALQQIDLEPSTIVVGPNGNTLEAWRDAPAFSKEGQQ